MKAMAKKSTLFLIAALLVLLVFGSAGAAGLKVADPPVKKKPAGTITRINFEVSGQKARRGLYIVQHPGGGELASWYGVDGSDGSGWLEDINFVHKNIYVEVIYYSGPGAEGTVMTIVNHAPGTEYGWLSKDKSHALEVAWPDEPLAGEMEMAP